ncbi:MBL fold metallo-hydrolase [Nocardioides ginsengisoli]|uniref:MBL fold metallo-hydrolase n=1 Tax=Nocardioides ginsengisoli TaxID=363868 RepID=A0ABW3VW18_9ACTN
MSSPLPWWHAPGCHPVADGVHRIVLSMPNDGLRAVNVYAIELDGRDLALIDGGWAVPSAVDELTAGLAVIGRTPADVRDVYVTHIHRDHYTFAVRLRERYGARVHLGRAEAPGLHGIQRLGSNVPTTSLHQLRRSGAAELADDVLHATRAEPFDPGDWADPDHWVDAGPIRLGDRTLEAVPTPGHTKGHLVFHDVEHRLLFTGDHVLPTITPSIGFELGDWDLPLGHYLRSLEALLERADAVLVPAHGLPGGSVHQRVRDLLAHHEERLAGTRAAVAVAPGQPAAAVAARLPWTRREVPLAELDRFNQMVAICETIAHLDVLVERGEVDAHPVAGIDLFC